MVKVIDLSNTVQCHMCNSRLSYEAGDFKHEELPIPGNPEAYRITDSIQCPNCKTWILVNSRHQLKPEVTCDSSGSMGIF